ncbi:MAG: PQQ-binding-like beta-propeller repeat protein [Planctomycetes bacterium]|nr:PQQ-binding-like beta-propeller repeat protein [Planctomycetota bacterium]
MHRGGAAYNSGRRFAGRGETLKGDVMEQTVWMAVALGVVAFLGLLVVGASLVSIRRKGRSTRTAFSLLGGVLVLAFAGAVTLSRWHQLRELFRGDVDDPAVLKGAARTEEGRKAAEPGEWPQWRGYHRDGLSPEKGLLTAWPPKGPKEVWRQSIGGGYASLAVSGGRLYTMDRQDQQERVLCFDANTGKELWTHSYEANYAGIQHAVGPRATPTVHEGRVYTVGASGVFLCLKAVPRSGNAEVFWQRDLMNEFGAKPPLWGVACSPLVEGDKVIVQPGGSKGSIVAFDRKTGKPAWTALDDPSSYSSPVAATAAGVRQIICFTGRRMVGLRASDGGLLWKYPWATQFDANIATPIVAGDLIFLSSAYNMGCALLRLAPDGDGVEALPARVRRNKGMRNHHASCVLIEDHLYGFDVNQSQRGFLKCVHLETFEEKWAIDDRELEKGCLIYADGHLLVLTQSGVLALVEATPTGFRKKAEAKLLEGSDCWALPTLAGGRLYLRDNEKLLCLDLKQ